MISSFFGKTSPITTIVILALLFILYCLVQFIGIDAPLQLADLTLKTLTLAVLILSILLLNFIISRNKLTGANAYAALFYVLLLMLFPEVLTDMLAVGCSFFLLLALRRIISVRTLKDIKLKIFDTTLWILVASLFYDWAVLYLVLVFMAIFAYEPKNIRNWAVPLTGIFAFLIIVQTFCVLSGQTNFLWEHYKFNVNLDFSRYNTLADTIKVGAFIVMVPLIGIITFFKAGKLGVGKLVTIRLIAIYFIIGLFIEVLLANQNTQPILLTFFPAVIFLSNYISSIKKPNKRELALMVAILVPFIVFITTLTTQST